MHQIDDMRHGHLPAALCARRMRELDFLAIAEKTAREKEVVDVFGSRLEVIALHSARASVGGGVAGTSTGDDVVVFTVFTVEVSR